MYINPFGSSCQSNEEGGWNIGIWLKVTTLSFFICVCFGQRGSITLPFPIWYLWQLEGRVNNWYLILKQIKTLSFFGHHGNSWEIPHDTYICITSYMVHHIYIPCVCCLFSYHSNEECGGWIRVCVCLIMWMWESERVATSLQSNKLLIYQNSGGQFWHWCIWHGSCVCKLFWVQCY